MKSSFTDSNSSNPSSNLLDSYFDKFYSFSDLKFKIEFLKDILNQNPDLTKILIAKIPFETQTMILDESTNLDDIFLYLELVSFLNPELCSKLMEYLFILEEENIEDELKFDPSIKLQELKFRCHEYLKNTLNVDSFAEAYEMLNKNTDERKIALTLTDIAIINEEIAKRMLWELFSKFKECEPKRFIDSLKILKWASEDLFLVISIIGTEKLLQSPNLKDFNTLLTMFIDEDPDLIYPLIVEVPDSKQAIKELIGDSSLVDLIYFLKTIETYSADYIDLLVNMDYDQEKILSVFKAGNIKSKLDFLKFIADYEGSLLYSLFVIDNFEILSTLLTDIKEHFDLGLFYNGLVFLNNIDKELSQDLLICIDPKTVTEQLLTSEDELLVINTFNTIASCNGSYLFYSLQSEFKDFINWLENFLTNIDDLETIALFLVSFQKIFTNTPELPVILTTIVKKLQREENLDDLGAFLGIIGNSEPLLLQLILNHLLPHLKLYPTDKIGYLLMTTSLYNLETGLGLVKHLAARFSSEYDLKVLRKSFESIILANTKVGEVLLKDKNFNIQVLKNNINKSDLLERVLFLETIIPIGKDLINQIIVEDEFQSDFFNHCYNLATSDMTKILSNCSWLNEPMSEKISDCVMKKINQKKFDLEDYYLVIHTSSWSNRKLCKKIIHKTNIDDLGEKLESLNRTDPIIDKIVSVFSEIEPEKAEKLIFDYLQNQF